MHTKLHECSMAQGPSTWAVAAFFSSQEEDDFLKLFKGSDKQMDMKGSRFCLCCSHESLGTGKLSPEGAAKNVIGGSPQTIIDLALLKTNFSSTEIKLLIFYSFSNACTDHWFSPSLSSRVLVSSGGKKERMKEGEADRQTDRHREREREVSPLIQDIDQMFHGAECHLLSHLLSWPPF